MHPVSNQNPTPTPSEQSLCDGCESYQHGVSLVGWQHLCPYCATAEHCDGCGHSMHRDLLEHGLCASCRETDAEIAALRAETPVELPTEVRAESLKTPAANDAHPGLCPDPTACEACQSRVWPSGSAIATAPVKVQKPLRLTPAAQAVRAALGGMLPRPGDLNVVALGATLGLSGTSVRRALRDLREAVGGAL